MSKKILTAEDFEDKIDQNNEFTIDFDLDGVPDFVLKLVECKRSATPSDYEGCKRHPFSLIFEGDRNQVMESKTYALNNKKFKEPLNIFLVAIGQTDNATLYEAVFC